MRTILIAMLAAVAATASALGQGSHPTATEAFHLQSECVKCGNKVLENSVAYAWTQAEIKNGKVPKYTVIQQAHYNAKDNHCYVTLEDVDLDQEKGAETKKWYHEIYDGQTGEMLAASQVEGLKQFGTIFKHERVPESSLPAEKTFGSSPLEKEIWATNQFDRTEAYIKYLMEGS